MELVVLGCSGSVEGPQAPASGYLIKGQAGDDLLLDMGPGVLAAMQREPDIDPAACHVALTHIHADHCLDFPSLLVWRRFHPAAPASASHEFIGPSIAFDHLSRAGADAPDAPDDFSDTFNINVFTAGSGIFDATRYPHATIGEFTLYAAEAIHPTESYMIRVEDKQGHSVVYTGDTAWTDNLADIAHGADVLLCEATWGENGDSKPSGMHISGEDAGKAAARAGVRKLILTHIPPWGDGEGAVRGAAKHFDGDIELARQGMRVQL